MASLFCPICGTENPSTRSFCRKCASDLHAPVQDPNAPVRPEPAAVPLRPILIGIGVAGLLIILLLGALTLLGGSPAASPTPSASAEPTVEVTLAPTEAPLPTATEAVVETITPTTEPTAAASPAPGDSGKPAVDSFTGPQSASCASDNGTGTPGNITLTWTSSNTSGVRLSVDPPAPNTAYSYGYADYGPAGSADLPFTCDPPNQDPSGLYHLYVATTIHDGGYFAWRLVKVYIRP